MLIKIARATVLATALIIGTAAVGGAQDLALVGGMLLDGYEGPVLHNAAIVIEGDRIVAVGPADQVQIPSNARVIDTRGMTMLPGLIDLHVHTMFLGHGESEPLGRVSQSDDFGKALTEAGAKDITYKRYTAGSGHGAFFRNIEETGPAMEAFFARTLGK